MKNLVESKNRNNTFDSNEFIHFIADLIGSLYIFHFLLSVSGSRNVIYFSITTMPKKSHSSILEMQIFVQNAKKHTVNSIFILEISFLYGKGIVFR